MDDAILSRGILRPMGDQVLVKTLLKEKQRRGGLIKFNLIEKGAVLPIGVDAGVRLPRGVLQQLFKKFDETASWILACLVAVIPFAAGAPQAAAASAPTAEPVYQVVSPIGESTVKMMAMAPRPDTLAGKRVCMVWNNAFKADVTHPAIGEALKKQYPDVKIVPYNELPVAPLPEPSGNPGRASEALQAAFKERGCDAVISGNGG